jgi:serine/threonine protein phosphatase PrpC
MEAAIISAQGVRGTMEDTHYLNPSFVRKGWLYLGIYDGHNGGTASAYAGKTVHREFSDRIKAGQTPQQAFIESYEKVSACLTSQESGTTAVDVFIKEGTVYTANAGDARVIIIGKNRVVQLTVDHRVENIEERERIEQAGGRIVYSYVSNGAGGIMPTRTLGDESFKAVGVIATPFVNEYRISPDDLVLLAACDGLFDSLSNEEVAGFARKEPDIKKMLDAIKSEVLVNRCGTDNLTVIAVRVNPPYSPLKKGGEVSLPLQKGGQE